jgi:hypothetical protein
MVLESHAVLLQAEAIPALWIIWYAVRNTVIVWVEITVPVIIDFGSSIPFLFFHI